MVIGIALTNAAFAQRPALTPFGGLLQRLTIALGMSWLSAVSLRALTDPPPAGQAPRGNT